MTLMAWEHPELFHILPCTYNYQVKGFAFEETKGSLSSLTYVKT
jgi:hypothetical protein